MLPRHPCSTPFPYTTLFRSLVMGAAVAYRDVIRGNRVLAAAGAYLHGICVAVLVQAIGFVSLVLAAQQWGLTDLDRKSTRLNSSHVSISYAVFCLKKKNNAR